jgi:hypothetical protein
MSHTVLPQIFVAAEHNLIILVDDDLSGDLAGLTEATVTYKKNGIPDQIWPTGQVSFLGPVGKPPVAALIPVTPTLLSAFSGGFFSRLLHLFTRRAYASTGDLTGNLKGPGIAPDGRPQRVDFSASGVKVYLPI